MARGLRTQLLQGANKIDEGSAQDANPLATRPREPGVSGREPSVPATELETGEPLH
jgi:hypothetical protein